MERERHGFGSRRRYGEPREMHKAVCSDCGEACEVPFEPIQAMTEDKEAGYNGYYKKVCYLVHRLVCSCISFLGFSADDYAGDCSDHSLVMLFQLLTNENTTNFTLVYSEGEAIAYKAD